MTTTTPRKSPTMNSPYATQTQIEARIASRLSSPERIRRALRLDNPFMWGVEVADDSRTISREDIPTPLYQTAGGSVLNPRDFANYR